MNTLDQCALRLARSTDAIASGGSRNTKPLVGNTGGVRLRAARVQPPDLSGIHGGIIMKVLTLFAIALTLTGCATVPPSRPDLFNTTRNYPASKDIVWDRAVEWFAVQNVPIKAIEKDSGIISGEAIYVLNNGLRPDQDAICKTDFLSTVDGYTVRLNILVRGDGAASSVRVTSTIIASVRYTVGNAMPRTIECQTTGRIEKSILDSIG